MTGISLTPLFPALAYEKPYSVLLIGPHTCKGYPILRYSYIFMNLALFSHVLPFESSSDGNKGAYPDLSLTA